MNLSEFTHIVRKQPAGVVLVEGRRAIAECDYPRAVAVGRHLATRFPQLIFRSGNAKGSDHAFSEGVAEVDASRLQVITPYASHRKSARFANAVYVSPDILSDSEEALVVEETINASPKNKSLIEKRAANQRLAAKAAYLIRDTMKVVGHSGGFSKPICALFYVDPDNPMDGGTGHTIRACQNESIPVVFQDAWMNWFE